MSTDMSHIMYMKVANIAEFRNNLGTYLGEVEQGATVEIRRRNVPVARVVPVRKSRRNRTVLGRGEGSVGIHGDLTEPLIPEGDWAMLASGEDS